LTDELMCSLNLETHHGAQSASVRSVSNFD
jgi:hypothetical protein